MRFALRRSVFSILISFLAASASVHAGDLLQFDLPPQALLKSLRAIGEQTGTNVLASAPSIAGLEAPALRGQMTADEAFKRLLAGSGLRHEFLDEKTVTFVAVDAKAASSAVREEGTDANLQLARIEAQSEEQKAQGGSDDRHGKVNEPAASKQQDQDIKEIIVTAQKREERLQDVPIAISVVSGAEMDRSTYKDVNEALRLVPGISFNPVSAFQPGNGISIRGVSSPGTAAGSSTAAFYVDGVAYGFVRGAQTPVDGNVFDLDRIEVLRGPQGTLYGANALNGVIRVLTHDADPSKFEVKARTMTSSTDGGGWSYGADGAINVPLVADKLAVRAIAGYRDDAGWIDSPVKKDVNSSVQESYRVKLTALPTDTTTIHLTAWRSKNSRDSNGDTSDDDRKVTSVENQFGNSNYTLYSAEIIQDFGSFTATSTTSWVKYINNGVVDGSPLQIPVLLRNDNNNKVFTEELNLASNIEGPFHWNMGFMYRNGRDHTTQDIFLLPGPGGFPTANYDDRSKSSAGYGESGYKFFDGRLDLTAGVRYFRDKQETQQNTPLGTFPLTPIKNTFDAWTPRFVATFFPSTDHTFYASYSEGFRSGISQTPQVLVNAPQFAPVRPDRLHNYEIGGKGNLRDNLFSYDVALYYIDWQDIIQNVFVRLPNGTTVAPGLVNATSASGMGFEIAGIFRPVNGFNVGGSFSYNDLGYDKDLVDATGALIAKKGLPIAFSPEYTVAGFANYEFPLSETLRGQFAVSASLRTRQVALQQSNGVYYADYGNAKFDGGLISFTVDADRWSAKLFADNPTNYYKSDGVQGVSGTRADVEWLVRPRPRTVGLQLQMRY